jgi:fibronectin type 3 domain-containing protein
VAGATYFYKVAAVNAIGEGPLSNEAEAIGALPPSAPTGLTAEPGDGEVRLNWQPHSFNGGTTVWSYQIWCGASSATVGFCYNSNDATTFTETGLTNGVPRYYRVAAWNGLASGPPSDEASATPALGYPSAPTLNTATPGNGQVTLTWTAPSVVGTGITSYKVYRGSTNPPATLLASGGCTGLDGNALSCTDDTAVNGQAYYYKVSAVNAMGEGAYSNALAPTPAVPGSLTLQTAVGADGRVILSWTVPNDGGSTLTDYYVYRGTTPGGEVFLFASSPGVPTATDFGVVNGVAYYYKVSAKNAIGEGPLSNELSATPTEGVDVPGSLTLLAATPGNGQVNLTWTVPSDGGSPLTGYTVYRGTTPGGELPLFGVSAGATGVTDSSAVNGQIYYYQVSARNAVGEGPLSNELSVTAGEVPGPVTLLTATPGNGQVALTWTVPSDGGSPLTHYRCYRGTTPGGEDHLFFATPGAPSATDFTAVNGIAYYYKVSALNAIGEGPLSNELSATPSGPVKTFTSSNIPTTGTVTNFANAQSDSDAGAEATLTEANTAAPTVHTLNANSTEASSGWTTPTNGWASDNQYAKATASNKLLRYGLTNPSGSGAITSVVIKAEVSILDATPPPDDKFRLTACFSTNNCGTEGPSTGAATTDSVISYDVTSAKPGGGAWTWTDLNNLQARVKTDATGSVDGTWQVDRVWIEATSTPPAIQKLEVQFLFTGVPGGATKSLELSYRVAPSTDTFIVQVWNGTAWTTRGTALNATSATDWTYMLTAAEYQGGSPKIRFLDATSGSAQGVLYVGYARIVTTP